LPAVIAARDAERQLMLPFANREDASLVRGTCNVVVSTLRQAWEHFQESPLPVLPPHVPDLSASTPFSEIRAIRGQSFAKQALLLAAAGGHHLLMVGPPGTGKTLLANVLPGLLPA